MKQSRLLLGLAAGMLFAGCSADDMEHIGGNEVAQTDEVRYLNVALCTPGAASRADFNEGTADENTVSTIRFYFYDVKGNPTASSVEVKDLEWSELDTEVSESVATTADKTLQVFLKKGDNMPAYVICLLNSVSDSRYDNLNMDDLRKLEADRIILSNGDKPLYRMSNSVYYGADPFKGETKTRICGTPINGSLLALSPEDAEANPALDIYVERYAAKVSFSLQGAVTPNTEAVNDYTLTFEPVAWGVNADAATTYAAKRFELQENAEDTKIEGVPSYADIEKALNPWVWNDEANHRSYWASSPSYYSRQFPQVADDILDNAGEAGVLLQDVYALRYYSYNQLTTLMDATRANEGAHGMPVVRNGLNSLYTFENTASSFAFQSSNPKAAVPSVVLAGKYTATPSNGAPALAQDGTFYLYGHSNNKWNLYTTEAAVKGAFVANQLVLATSDNETNPAYLRDADRAGLVIKHPAKAVRELASTLVPSRFETLQIDETAIPANLYYLDGAAWVAVTEENITAVNARLMQTLGFAQKYHGGACYYSIPVKHLRFEADKANNPNADLSVNSSEFKWNDVRVGDFGLVRNHAYTIEVTGIKGLATAVSDPTVPIVPPMDEDEYYVNYKINILKWATVPSQKLEL